MIYQVLRTAGLALAIAACSSGSSPSDVPVFGEPGVGCGVTVLTNDISDEGRLRAGVECLLGQVDADESVVWDLLVPTVEGDPILYRFDSDGTQITITEDTTRDEFGAGGAVVRVCDSIAGSGFVPQGRGCTESGGAAFLLPAEIWPP